MGALEEQHSKWTEARNNLGMPLPPVARKRVPEAIPLAKPVPLDPILLFPVGAHFAFEEAEQERDWRRRIEAICVAHGTTPAEVKGTRRDKNLIAARRAISLYFRDRGWSFSQIGKWMNRDHSSILNQLNPRKSAAKNLRRKARIQRLQAAV